MANSTGVAKGIAVGSGGDKINLSMTTSDDFMKLKPGDLVSVSGKIISGNKKIARATIGLMMSKFYATSETYHYLVGWADITNAVSAGSSSKYDAAFTIKDTVLHHNGVDVVEVTNPDAKGRGPYELCVYICFQHGDGSIVYGVIHNYDFPWGGSSGTAWSTLSSIVWARYWISPEVNSLEICRCNENGTPAVDGKYLRCNKFEFSISDKASKSDLGPIKIDMWPTPESYPSDSILDPDWANGITFEPGGYYGVSSASIPFTYEDGAKTPSDPSWFFRSITVDTATQYHIRIYTSLPYESGSKEILVEKAFAKLHISANPTGGIGIGQFSNSVQENGKPLFEVARTHQSRFYGGIYGISSFGKLTDDNSGILSRATQSREECTYGRWVDNKPIYRFICVSEVGNSLSSDTAMATLRHTPETVLGCFGVVKMTNRYWRFLPFTTQSGNVFFPFFDAADDTIYIHSTVGQEITKIIVVMYYTRVDDEPIADVEGADPPPSINTVDNG